MCECKDPSIDVVTPRNVYLSAFYRRTFAYHTIKNRVPTILTSLIDNLVRKKQEIYEEYGEGSKEELKKVLGEISKLKYEIQTNKPLTNLSSKETDAQQFNEYIAIKASEDGRVTYFNTVWLLAECYIYKRLRDIFTSTNTLKDFDYFQSSKKESYEKMLDVMANMAVYVLDQDNDESDKKKKFITLLKMNVWGNKCDLSVSLGVVDNSKKLSHTALEKFILCDHSERIWDALCACHDDHSVIDIILDNSGYEVFTDCCLADYIVEKKFARKIRFYVKTTPWFISDVMTHDFHWMVDQLQQNPDDYLKTLGNRWAGYLQDKSWELLAEPFWTSPYEFKCMKTADPDLYRKLSEAKLSFYKGDLNYRKLFGEINWDPTTPIEEALQGYHPTKLAILRTIKAEIVVGLRPGTAEQCERKDPKWMEKGDYALIQYCDKIVKI